MVARVLDIILVHNLLQTTHKIDMLDDWAHLVAILMKGKAIDVPAIMCHVMLQTTIEDGTKRGLSYRVMVTQILEQCGVTFSHDVVTFPQGLPIDDASIKRIEAQRWVVPQVTQVVGEATQPVLVHVDPLTTIEVPPPPTPLLIDAAGSFVTPPSASAAPALALSMTLPLALSSLIRDINWDFRHILRCFDYLEKKVESVDQRLIHIEGIVDPSRAPAPRVGLDILASEDDGKDEESDEDAKHL